MFAALRIGLLGALMLSSAEPPDIAGQWSGEDWGTVVLNQTIPGNTREPTAENVGTKPGKIQLKWSPIEQRFNGTWREGEDRFGELSLRLVGDEIRGAQTTDPKSKINHARPHLADVTWIRGAAKPVPPREAADRGAGSTAGFDGFVPNASLRSSTGSRRFPGGLCRAGRRL